MLPLCIWSQGDIPFIRLPFTDHMNVKLKTCWKSKSRKKKQTMLMLLLLILLLSKEKNALVFFAVRRLSGMYLCITCGPHFARCLSYEMKQFLRLKNELHFCFCCLKGPTFKLPFTFNYKSTHNWAVIKNVKSFLYTSYLTLGLGLGQSIG